MKAARALLFAGVATAASCSVGEIDYTGKSCPCPAEWVCNAGRCARSGGASGNAVPGDTTEGAIRVKNLRATWATPATIRWQWDVEGDRDRFGGFEIVVTSPKAGAGGAKTWTGTERPELTRLYLATRGGSDILVTSTMTEGHDADTPYLAVLTAYDSAGRKSVTNEARTTTEVALTRRVVLFSEQRPVGYPLPSVLEVAAGCGAAGSDRCIRYRTAADPERACTTFGCTQNLRWQGLGIATDVIDRGVFDQRAYLEAYVRSTGTTVSYYSLLWISVAGTNEVCGPDREGCNFNFLPWTFRPSGEYRRLQVPLRVFQSDAGPTLSYEALLRGIDGFNVGAAWGQEDVIDLDELAIWY